MRTLLLGACSALALMLGSDVAMAAQDDEDEVDFGIGEVVVTATLIGDVNVGLIGGSATTIDSTDVQNRQTQLVSDLIRDVPGIEVSRTGTVGGQTQIRIRGTEGNHTMVLIDGMEANDPFAGEFDFATLIADDVARVEVLRGQQSALYGSDAIGGVIHYITATGAEAPGFSGRVEGGSFGTGQISARAAGVSGIVDYSFSGNIFHTDGVPTARDGTRNLRADILTLASKTIFSFADNFDVTAVGRFNKSEAQTNPQDFNFPPGPTFGLVIDGNDHFEAISKYGSLVGDLRLLNGQWVHSARIQYNDGNRKNFEGTDLTGHSFGSRLKAGYVSSYSIGMEDLTHNLTFAIDHEKETFQNKVTAFGSSEKRVLKTTGFVGDYFLNWNDTTGLGAAVRFDDNSGFENATTYRLQASHIFPTGTRVRAAAGTGVKNPTNTELFGFNAGTFMGNPNLVPEKSRGWEAGIEQTLFDGHGVIGATYFKSTLENEIFTSFGPPPDFLSSPDNRTTDSHQQGIELFLQAYIGEAWRVDASYTYLDAEENGVKEIRRAPHIASLNVAWRSPSDRVGLNLTVRHNGEQTDTDFGSFTTVTLPAYTLVNIGGDVRITDKIQLFGRVENVFDEKYEEVFSFRAPGLGAYLGVRLAS